MMFRAFITFIFLAVSWPAVARAEGPGDTSNSALIQHANYNVAASKRAITTDLLRPEGIL